MLSESSTCRWAELQLPCTPSKLGELPEKMLQNLLLNLLPQTVLLQVSDMADMKGSFISSLNVSVIVRLSCCAYISRVRRSRSVGRGG